MAWTEDRVEKLKSMWTEGNSASHAQKNSIIWIVRNKRLFRCH